MAGGKPTRVPAKVGYFAQVVSGIGALHPPSAGGPSCATLANSGDPLAKTACWLVHQRPVLARPGFSSSAGRVSRRLEGVVSLEPSSC